MTRDRITRILVAARDGDVGVERPKVWELEALWRNGLLGKETGEPTELGNRWLDEGTLEPKGR
jgi:hypothetical protein